MVDMFRGNDLMQESYKPVDADTRRERERMDRDRDRTNAGLAMNRLTGQSSSILPPDIRRNITSFYNKTGGKRKYTRRKNSTRSHTTYKKKRKMKRKKTYKKKRKSCKKRKRKIKKTRKTTG